MNILFVCTGNTCRSPMAEAILKSKIEAGQVRSAGIFAGKGEKLAENSEIVLGEIDLTLDHQTNSVDKDSLAWADLVLTMTDRHKQTLALQYPEYEDKYYTLKEYVLVDEDQWDKLKDLYSSFEEKRSAIINEHQSNLDAYDLEKKLLEDLGEEIQEIKQMESDLPDLNITDPFGGNVTIYRNTRDELEEHIELLVKMLERNDS